MEDRAEVVTPDRTCYTKQWLCGTVDEDAQIPSAMAGEKRKRQRLPRSCGQHCRWQIPPLIKPSLQVYPIVKVAHKEGRGEAARKGRSLEADDMVRTAFIEVPMMHVSQQLGHCHLSKAIAFLCG